MTAIWQNDGTKWKLLSPAEFADEAKLHTLIEEGPQLLPLAGSPTVVIVGREVQLGSGYADLIGIEPSGRLVLLEIKLARNAEARRAIVAQVLAYAAYLYGLDAESLERDVLGKHLRDRGYESLAAAVSSVDQGGQFDGEEFATELRVGLVEGRFRVVLVLDQAPEELIRLVGYLESISDKILIDLVTISSYRIGESTVIVPQRVDPERAAIVVPQTVRPSKAKGHEEPGAELFIDTIERADPADRPLLHKLTDWAIGLEKEGLCQLSSFQGIADRSILLPRLRSDNAGLISIWNERGGVIQFWRSVFERRAPQTLLELERFVAPAEIRQGNNCRKINDQLLAILAKAYCEANGRNLKA